jgi:hypothetical protein
VIVNATYEQPKLALGFLQVTTVGQLLDGSAQIAVSQPTLLIHDLLQHISKPSAAPYGNRVTLNLITPGLESGTQRHPERTRTILQYIRFQVSGNHATVAITEMVADSIRRSDPASQGQTLHVAARVEKSGGSKADLEPL